MTKTTVSSSSCMPPPPPTGGFATSTTASTATKMPQQQQQQQNHHNRKKRVIILGSGISGLACANELLERRYDVLVLEARTRPGGRIKTLNLALRHQQQQHKIHSEGTATRQKGRRVERDDGGKCNRCGRGGEGEGEGGNRKRRTKEEDPLTTASTTIFETTTNKEGTKKARQRGKEQGDALVIVRKKQNKLNEKAMGSSALVADDGALPSHPLCQRYKLSDIIAPISSSSSCVIPNQTTTTTASIRTTTTTTNTTMDKCPVDLGGQFIHGIHKNPIHDVACLKLGLTPREMSSCILYQDNGWPIDYHTDKKIMTKFNQCLEMSWNEIRGKGTKDDDDDHDHDEGSSDGEHGKKKNNDTDYVGDNNRDERRGKKGKSTDKDKDEKDDNVDSNDGNDKCKDGGSHDDANINTCSSKGEDDNNNYITSSHVIAGNITSHKDIDNNDTDNNGEGTRVESLLARNCSSTASSSSHQWHRQQPSPPPLPTSTTPLPPAKTDNDNNTNNTNNKDEKEQKSFGEIFHKYASPILTSLSPAQQLLFQWHKSNLELSCGTNFEELGLTWNDDESYGYSGSHCCIVEGFGAMIEALAEGVTVRYGCEVQCIEILPGNNKKKRRKGGKRMIKGACTDGTVKENSTREKAQKADKSIERNIIDDNQNDTTGKDAAGEVTNESWKEDGDVNDADTDTPLAEGTVARSGDDHHHHPDTVSSGTQRERPTTTSSSSRSRSARRRQDMPTVQPTRRSARLSGEGLSDDEDGADGEGEDKKPRRSRRASKGQTPTRLVVSDFGTSQLSYDYEASYSRYASSSSSSPARKKRKVQQHGRTVQQLIKEEQEDGMDAALYQDEYLDGEDGTKVLVTLTTGLTLWADAVVCTLPLGVLALEPPSVPGSITFHPPLPPRKRLAFTRLGCGRLNKCALTFPTIFWQQSDFLGFTSPVPGKNILFTNMSAVHGRPVLVMMFGGLYAHEMESLTDETVVCECLDVLRKICGRSAVPDPVDYAVTRWGMEKYSRGAFVYVPRGVDGTTELEICAEPIYGPVEESGVDDSVMKGGKHDRDEREGGAHPLTNQVPPRRPVILFAGEHTTPYHPSTIHGAFSSGIREAYRLDLSFEPTLNNNIRFNKRYLYQRTFKLRRLLPGKKAEASTVQPKHRTEEVMSRPKKGRGRMTLRKRKRQCHVEAATPTSPERHHGGPNALEMSWMDDVQRRVTEGGQVHGLRRSTRKSAGAKRLKMLAQSDDEDTSDATYPYYDHRSDRYSSKAGDMSIEGASSGAFVSPLQNGHKNDAKGQRNTIECTVNDFTVGEDVCLLRGADSYGLDNTGLNIIRSKMMPPFGTASHRYDQVQDKRMKKKSAQALRSRYNQLVAEGADLNTAAWNCKPIEANEDDLQQIWSLPGASGTWLASSVDKERATEFTPLNNKLGVNDCKKEKDEIADGSCSANSKSKSTDEHRHDEKGNTGDDAMTPLLLRKSKRKLTPRKIIDM